MSDIWIHALQSFAAYQGTSLADTSLRPTFTLTPYSARAHIPVLDMPELNCTLVLMPWVDQGTRWNVGLLIGPCALSSSSDPSRPLHCVCVNRLAYWGVDAHDGELKVACLGRKWSPAIRWTDIHLVHRLPVAARLDPRASLRHPPLTLDTALRAPFRFSALDGWRYLHYNWMHVSSPSVLQRLWGGEDLGGTEDEDADAEDEWQWDGMPPALVVFSDGQGDRFTLRFGRCEAPPSAPGGEMSDQPNPRDQTQQHQQGALWADMQPGPGGDDLATRPHDCATDHIERWPLRTRVFSLGHSDAPGTWFMGYWKVRVAFTPCRLHQGTLVAHVIPRRHPDRPSLDATSYRALYDEVYLVSSLLFYWGPGEVEKAPEDVARAIEAVSEDGCPCLVGDLHYTD